MDVNRLLQCFSATLQADTALRNQAEGELRKLATAPGFLGGCLDILSSPSVETPVKKATAVFFKNRILKFWNGQQYKIDEDEKPVIRDRIVGVLAKSDYNSKQQLIPVLRAIVSHDFPKKWPNLLMETCGLLESVPNSSNDEDLSHLYTGLLCFAEIARNFRWVKNEDRSKELDPIIIEVFPHLLNIGNSLVSQHAPMTEVKAEILKSILKAYKFVTYYDLPEVLQTRESLSFWGELHYSITSMPPPAYVTTSNLSDQEKSFLQISKCYKWSVANINRIFTRYASRSLSQNYNYDAFHAMFINDYIPQLIQTYWGLIEQWCNNQRWLSLSCLYHLLQFLSHSVTQKETWPLIKPYFENLVSHLIYPLLCPSDHVLEVFENDPHEYINSNFDINEDMDTPDMAALGLLITFVDKRKKFTLEPIIIFAYNQLNLLQQQQPETMEIAKKKDGALRLIGGISHYVTVSSSPYFSQMEQILTNLVFPNLNSKFDFLKARTLEVCLKFADLDFKDEKNLSVLFHGILDNFGANNKEASLPVNLECALAIQAYLPMPQFQEVLSTIILPTMSGLLELSNEIDNDAISMVMQECVENFSEQLQPFGVDLMTKLVEQFMTLAREVNEASNVDVDDFDGEYKDQSDKVMAAIGFLNTMITVLLSFENSREICAKLEEVFSPAIEYCLTNDLDDFLTEISELMENSIFLLRYTTPIMWRNFSFLCKSFESGIALMYIEELIPCLQNFLIFGQDEIAKNQLLRSTFFDIIKKIIETDTNDIGLSDIIYDAELSQTFILTLQNYSSEFIPGLLSIFLNVYHSVNKEEQHIKNNSFDVNINNIIVSALTYDPNLTLTILKESNELTGFFNQWFTLLPLLSRVYDLKLSILGLISLVNNKEALANLEPAIIKHIAPNIAHLYSQLPKALEEFSRKRKTFSMADFDAFDRGQTDWVDEGYGDDEDLDPEEIKKLLGHDAGGNSNEEYLNFLLEENLKLKNSGFYDEEDELIVEDPLASTPLDNVDAFQVLRDFMSSLQQNDGATYSIVFGELNEAQQQVLQDALEKKIE